jgi:hypothetical protein
MLFVFTVEEDIYVNVAHARRSEVDMDEAESLKVCIIYNDC